MAGLVRPDDLMLVNRAGADFQTEVKNLRKPISDHEPLPGPGPWEGAEAIYHVIRRSSSGFKVNGQDKIYNLTNQAEVSSIDRDDLGEWVITGVNTKFTSSYGEWDFGDLTDTSNVTDMSNMFYDAFSFNSDISNWDVSNVTNMNNMFYNAEKFNQDISKWEVGNVQNMVHMFESAAKFNQDLGNWKVGNVTDMSNMFFYASQFNQDLSGWCVDQEWLQHYDFRTSSAMPLDLSHDPVWGTCPGGK